MRHAEISMHSIMWFDFCLGNLISSLPLLLGCVLGSSASTPSPMSWVQHQHSTPHSYSLTISTYHYHVWFGLSLFNLLFIWLVVTILCLTSFLLSSFLYDMFINTFDILWLVLNSYLHILNSKVVYIVCLSVVNLHPCMSRCGALQEVMLHILTMNAILDDMKIGWL